MKGPDFVIIGAMKCGTTTLAAQLGAQANIFMTDPKEPNFFSDDDIFAKGFDWYHSLFESASPHALKGEASTHYTKLPDYPHTLERMKTALPHLKLIYMVRNPMDRLVSHYMHSWSLNEAQGTLEQTLSRDPSLVNYGLYGWQIRPFVETYGASSVLLTSLERLKASPDEELMRIANHIEYDADVAWISDLEAQNVSSDRMRRLPLQSLLIDNSVARSLRRTLVPKSLRTKIRDTRLMQERPKIPDARRSVLETKFRDDQKLLAEFFPDDPSLELIYNF